MGLSRPRSNGVIRKALVNADGAHLAVVSSLLDKEQLLVDGKPGAYYDSIEQNTITQDGRHVAYIGWRSPSLSEFEAVTGARLTDASKVEVAIFKQTPLLRAVVDNKEQGGFFVTALYLHLVSARFTYVNHPKGRTDLTGGVEVRIDGERGAEYQSCERIMFSEDGKRIAYVATKQNRAYVIVDDQELGPFENVDSKSFQFSSNGAHFGFLAKPAAQSSQAMIIDGNYVPNLYQVSNLILARTENATPTSRTQMPDANPC